MSTKAEIRAAHKAGKTAGRYSDDENPYLDPELIDAWDDGFAERENEH